MNGLATGPRAALSRGWARWAPALLRLRSFDISTAAGRAGERHRRAAFTALASVAARGVQALTVLVSVPLTVGYLGTERFGLWMAMSSVIAMLNLADLGIGNGLLNAISEANGRDDRDLARRHASSALFLLTGIAALLGAVFAAIYPWVSWAGLFNVSSPQAVAEAGPAMVVFVACFLVNMPLGAIKRIRQGYQEGYRNSLWEGGGNLLGLAGLLLLIYLEAGLPWLVLAMAGAPALAALLNGIALMGFQWPWLRPGWRWVSAEVAGRLFRVSMYFFLMQIAVAVAFSSDYIVATRILGPEATAQYAVAMKMFSIPALFIGMALVPLWPAYGEAITRGDVDWVRKTLIRSLALVLIFTVPPSLFLVLLGGPVAELWVGPEIVLPFLLLLGLGLWTVLGGAGNAASMFLNGANVIRPQAVLALLMAAVAITGKILLAESIGIAGIIWATVLSYAVLVAIPYVALVSKTLSSLRGGVD